MDQKCLDSADVDISEMEGLEEVFAESDGLCKATKTFFCTSVDENWKQSAGYVVREEFLLHLILSVIDEIMQSSALLL